MYNFSTPLLKKAPKCIIIHIGTNDAIDKSSTVIMGGILKLKMYIENILPSVHLGHLACQVLRLDNPKARLAIHHLTTKMKSLNVNVISHENIDNSCIGKVGLPLNLKGIGRLTDTSLLDSIVNNSNGGDISPDVNKVLTTM